MKGTRTTVYPDWFDLWYFCFDLPSLDWLQDDIKYEDLAEKMTDQYSDANFGFYH